MLHQLRSMQYFLTNVKKILKHRTEQIRLKKNLNKHYTRVVLSVKDKS